MNQTDVKRLLKRILTRFGANRSIEFYSRPIVKNDGFEKGLTCQFNCVYNGRQVVDAINQLITSFDGKYRYEKSPIKYRHDQSMLIFTSHITATTSTDKKTEAPSTIVQYDVIVEELYDSFKNYITTLVNIAIYKQNI